MKVISMLILWRIYKDIIVEEVTNLLFLSLLYAAHTEKIFQFIKQIHVEVLSMNASLQMRQLFKFYFIL